MEQLGPTWKGFRRGLVICVAVLAGAFVGAPVECSFVNERDRGGCIPVVGMSIGAIGAGVGAARLTRPRQGPPHQDPDLEEQIRERQRRWNPEDD